MSSFTERRAQQKNRKQLRTIEFLSDFPNAELDFIDHVATKVAVPAGHYLTHADEPGREAFVVVDGELAVERNGEQVAKVGPGAVAGEAALLTASRRNADVVTTQPTTLLVMSKVVFKSIATRCPHFASKVSEVHSHRTDTKCA